MTQEELDALPEDGGFTFVDTVIDGKRYRQAVMLDTVGVLFAKDGEPETVIDSRGQRWRVGWANGTRYKRRMSDL